MNEELAKKITDAGFPMNPVVHQHFLKVGETDGEVFMAYNPTLSELIGACGEKLRYLQRVENNTDWVAGTYDSYESGVGLSDSNVWKGPTPEEAVARLWLALNGR